EIHAELQRMITERMSGVAHPLELILLFVERAVTGVDVQRVSEVEPAGALQIKRRHAGRVEVIVIKARDSGVLRRSRPQTVRIYKDAIAEVSETEIGQPIRPQNIVEAVGKALIAERCRAGERCR